eukprot:9343251-Heterocapsa_arctica.AAC.1
MALAMEKRSGSLLVALMEQRKCHKALSKRGEDGLGLAAPTPLLWDGLATLSVITASLHTSPGTDQVGTALPRGAFISVFLMSFMSAVACTMCSSVTVCGSAPSLLASISSTSAGSTEHPP